MTYEVSCDVSQIVNAATQLNKVGARTRKAIVSALNRAGDQGFTIVKRELAHATGVKQAQLTNGSAGLRKVPANAGTMEYDVVARSSETPLSYFSPRQTKPGVSAAPWGKRRVFQGTFLATMKSGHVGVFKHEGPSTYARRINASGRVYYSATNIKQLWGPSIAKEMLKDPIPADFQKTVLAAFEPRLTHEIGRMLAAIDPKSKGAAIPEPQA